MKLEAVISCVALAGVALQGCGGAGDDSNSTTEAKSTTSTTTTPTTSWKPPPGPRDGQELADMMNAEYNGYEKGNPNSPMGNYIRVTADIDSGNLGLFCGGDCFDGKPDCTVKGSIFNHVQMIDPANGNPGGWFGSTSNAPLTGWYVNSTLIKTKGLSKCLYAWDGATDSRLNNGCGCSATGEPKCTDPACAFNNMCDGAQCTAESPAVSSCYCGNMDQKDWPADGVGSTCFFKGPAFDQGEDETHLMLDWRADHQGPEGEPRQEGMANMLAWNELVLDGNLLVEALKEDPAGVIMAMVYSESADGLRIAKQMASDFQKKYQLEAPLPVLFLDQSVDARTRTAAPWVFKKDDQPTGSLFV